MSPEGDPHSVSPVDEGRLLWTETDYRGVVSYRVTPAAGARGPVFPDGTDRARTLGPVSASANLVVGSASGGMNTSGRWGSRKDPEVHILRQSGDGSLRVPIEDEASTHADGNARSIEAHIAPGRIVVTGFGTGTDDHAHVIGLGTD